MRTPYVVYLQLGRPHLGAWCDDCLLPSAFEADVCTVSEDGHGMLLAVAVVSRIRACLDCHVITLVG